MSLRATVLVPCVSDAGSLDLTSLDQQTLPAAEFEVLVVDDGADPATSTRLSDVIAHRTNVRRVAIEPGASAQEALDTALADASGEYVLVLPTHRRITREALARLCQHADVTAADVCLGLTGVAGTRPATLPPTHAADPVELGADDPLRDPATGRIHRRSTADPALLASELEGAAAALPPGVRAAAVTSLTCFVDGRWSGSDVPALPERARYAVRASAVIWSAGALEITASVSAIEAEDVRVSRASIFSKESGVERSLDDLDVEKTPEGANLVLRIDPEDVPGVGRLPAGIWWPTVDVGDDSLLIEIAPRLAEGATLRGRPVVSFAKARRLGLDVGGSAHQPIRRLDPRQSSVVEDSRGSLLSCRLSNIDVAPEGRVTGSLKLGSLPVVAWLERGDGDAPVLRAWVSGLAGSSNLATQFTPAPQALTGARLAINGVGVMNVRRARRKTRRKTSGAAPTPSVPAPTTLVAKARRLAGRGLRAIRR
jgi:hypothetical protein